MYFLISYTKVIVMLDLCVRVCVCACLLRNGGG